MMKKLLFFGIALVLGAGGLVAHAQEVPSIYVRNVHASQNTYTAGDTVNGTFQLINSSEQTVPDVVYHVSLASGYQKNGLISNIYSPQVSESVILSPGERKDISFSYKLPTSFDPHNLTIHVQAFLKSGIPLGWGDYPITVTGGIAPLTLNNAAVVIDGHQFALQVGPMIYPGTTTSSTLSVTITNPSSDSVSLTPHVTIYDRTTSGTKLDDEMLPAQTIASKGSATITYPLNTFNGTPGVYAGEISFNDANSVPRLQTLQFRYIVAGTIVNIVSVTSAKTTVAHGESLPIAVSYSGNPYDIVTGQSAGDDTATLNAAVYNELDQVVGTYSDTTDFNGGSPKTINLTAEVPAKALRVEVTATKNGKTLASYSTNLTPNYDDIRRLAVNEAHKGRTRNLVYALGDLILAILLIIGIRYINLKKTAALMIVFSILTMTAFGTLAQSTQAYTETGRHSYNAVWYYGSDPWLGQTFSDTYLYPPNNGSSPDYTQSCGGNEPDGYTNADGSHWLMWECKDAHTVTTDFSPFITINSPGDLDTFSPGQTFYLTGSAYAYACLNSMQDISISATFNGLTLSTTSVNTNNYTGESHASEEGGTTFSIGPFTVPSTPGTYSLSFRVDNNTGIPNVDPATGKTNLQLYDARINPATGQTYGSNSSTKDNLQPSAFIGGYVTGTVNIVAGTPPPTVTISAAPTPIDYGGTSVVTWTTTNNPTTCYGTDGDSAWSGSKLTSGSNYATQTLYGTTKYTITCSNAGGSDTESTYVNVNACVSRADNKTKVAAALLADASPGSTSDNPDSSSPPSSSPASSSPGGGGGNPCPGGGGNPPVVSIYANPNPVTSGSASTITWYSNNANYCYSSDFNTGYNSSDPSTFDPSKNNSVGVSTGNLTSPPSSKTYTITCTNTSISQSASASIVVNIVQPLVASCRPTTAGHDPASSTTVGTQVTWQASVTGPYSSIQWIGTDISGNPTGTSLNMSYTTVGVKSASIVVSQSDGSSKTFSCSLPVNVKPAQVFKEI